MFRKTITGGMRSVGINKYMQSVVFIIRGLGLTQPTSEAWPTRNPKYPHSE